jgi:acylglycerol lipase
VGVAALVTRGLFGPGVDAADERARRSLTAREQSFLREHVHARGEETGFLTRPRPGGQRARIFYRFWLPKHVEAAERARGVVVVLHGLNSHSARNGNFMVEVLRSGFVVAGLDHEGMGRSDGRHGFFPDGQALIDDAVTFVQLVKDKFPGQKVFLHGGSLGGLLILHMLADSPGLVDGAVILCPAVQVHSASRPSKAVELAGRFLRAYAPKLPLASGNRGKNSSPEVAAAIDAEKFADPLYYHGRMRVGTGLAMLDMIEAVGSKLPRVDTPYLLQHGTADRACSVEGSADLHHKTRSADKTFRTYEGGAHDLSNEPAPIRDAVVHDFIAWLEARSG